MTNEKKMTNREALVSAIEMVANEEVKEKLQKMLEALDKKANVKSSKRKEATDLFAQEVLNTLSLQPNRIFTATEVARLFNFEYTVQKISYALRILADDNKVEKVVTKKGTTYQYKS